MPDRTTKITLRIASMLLILMVVIAFVPQNVVASETRLTIIVPDEVTLQLKIVGSGTVEYLGRNYGCSTSLKLPFNTDAVFSFSPGKGYHIESVAYNGKSQNALLINEVLTLSNVEPDSVLTVVFSQHGDNPFTGDTFPLMQYIGIVLASLFIITIFLVTRRKQ